MRIVSNRTGLFCAFAAFLGIMFFLGCDNKKEARDQTTLERVSLQYWTDRLVTRDYEPAYNREADNASMSLEEYRKLVSRNENFKFSGLKIDRVNIENDGSLVYVTLKCMIPNVPKVIERTFKDKWIYQSNQWKHKFVKTQP
ncbi:MAG: hypothetical protein ISS62_10550 [Desulfobacteraceae bacterium]|nr:hypothetical protein [Desulfobacteraceae bacterium]